MENQEPSSSLIHENLEQHEQHQNQNHEPSSPLIQKPTTITTSTHKSPIKSQIAPSPPTHPQIQTPTNLVKKKPLRKPFGQIPLSLQKTGNQVQYSNLSDKEEEGKVKDLELQLDRASLKIFFPEAFTSKLSNKWQRSLIIKLTGASMNMEHLKNKLLSLWKIKGTFEIITAGCNYFIIHDLFEDYKTKIITVCPWKLGNNPLLVRTWIQDFSAQRETNNNITTTWVNIRYLPKEYYTVEVLILLGTLLEKPVALDGRNT